MISVDSQVCNMALSFLKVPPITSLSSPSTEVARTCALWYDPTRKETLRQHPWNFAKERVSLGLDATSPAFGYANRYKLPADFMRLRFIGEDNIGLQSYDYDLEQGYILIDNNDGTSLDIGYIKDVTNVGEFDSLFTRCLALTLAANMSYAVTGKITVRKDILSMLVSANAEARAINGQDKPPVRINRSRVIGARRKYGTGSSYREDPTRIYVD